MVGDCKEARVVRLGRLKIGLEARRFKSQPLSPLRRSLQDCSTIILLDFGFSRHKDKIRFVLFIELLA